MHNWKDGLRWNFLLFRFSAKNSGHEHIVFCTQIGRSNGSSGRVFLFWFFSFPLWFRFNFVSSSTIAFALDLRLSCAFITLWLNSKLHLLFCGRRRKKQPGKLGNKQSKQKIVYWNMSVIPYRIVPSHNRRMWFRCRLVKRRKKKHGHRVMRTQIETWNIRNVSKR